VGRPRNPRPPKLDAKVVVALSKCWAVVNAPAGKRLAPILGELVPVLRGRGELDIGDDTAVLLVAMSAATVDRRLAPARSALVLKGRSHTKPGSLLKSRIPMRTWADHDQDTAGFVEIDLVGHEGGNSCGEFCFTLTVTDIATGWTQNRTAINQAQVHVFAALTDIVEHLPFPIREIDSDYADLGIMPTFQRCPRSSPRERGRVKALVCAVRRCCSSGGERPSPFACRSRWT
jgi:hypothetical protein